MEKSCSMNEPARWLRLLPLLLAAGCSDGNNHSAPSKSEHLRPVPVESMVPYKQVFLASSRDSILNCDTASEYRVLLKAKAPAEAGEGGYRYDVFTANGYNVPLFTFLKSSGDSLFFVATINKGGPDNFFSGICIERRDIARAFMESESSGPKPEGKKAHAHGRHRGGGGGFGSG
ncbi:MAG: hypothetical protein JWO30_4701 [Fibrobacteres bacterium]|nr:hypothetical protein [Fibrobacterota bacterium]